MEILLLFILFMFFHDKEITFQNGESGEQVTKKVEKGEK